MTLSQPKPACLIRGQQAGEGERRRKNASYDAVAEGPGAHRTAVVGVFLALVRHFFGPA